MLSQSSQPAAAIGSPQARAVAPSFQRAPLLDSGLERAIRRMEDGEPLAEDDVLVAATLGRIVIAEEDDQMRMLLASMLRRDGYEVLEARTGRQLLRYIGSFLRSGRLLDPPDLIISDVRMPGASGVELVAGLRRADWITPVILLSASGDAERPVEASRLGVCVLARPLDIKLLRAAVQRLAPRI